MRIGLGFRINVAHRRPPKSFFSSLLEGGASALKQNASSRIPQLGD